jgi:DNA polymerase III subunit delta'
MPFSEILGQAPAVRTLERALSAGRVHHAYRFEGPAGVGKRMAAFALAQALVCETDGALGCGHCSACQRAVTLSEEEPRVPLHPDVVLVERGLYRGTLGSAEASGISIEQVRRVVLSRMGFAPHEGRALVFIVKGADELSVQAANALLKTLEEPLARTHFILITSRPNRLLDTIRSRTLPVRFGPLPDAIVAQILEAKGLPSSVAPLGQGSARLACELCTEAAVKDRDDFESSLAAAVLAKDLAPALKFAESHRADRDVLRELLAFFAQSLAARAREGVREVPSDAERTARKHEIVLKAMQDVERNVQPALALESMIYRLRQA